MLSASSSFKQKMSGSPSTSEKEVTTQLQFGIYSVKQHYLTITEFAKEKLALLNVII